MYSSYRIQQYSNASIITYCRPEREARREVTEYGRPCGHVMLSLALTHLQPAVKQRQVSAEAATAFLSDN